MGGGSTQASRAPAAAAATATNEVDEMMECDDTIMTVAELQKQGVNAADIAKLNEAGISTVGMILKVPLKTLAAIKGFSEAKIEKVRSAARKLEGGGSSMFKTGNEIRERRKKCLKITTGAKAFDAILGGGVETGSITEVYGEFRTGKTQLSHTLAVTSQLAYESGGAQGKVIYLDTEGNFRPERIEKIAERFGLDPEATLDNIIVARAYASDQQMEMLKPLAGLIAEHGPFKLLIVDSIIALFRVDYHGRGELSDRQQKLGQHLSELTRMAEEFNLSVFLVNQCQADPGAMSMFAPVVKPVGGNVLAHASCTRLHLKKGRENQRVAKLVDSPSMPEADAPFALTDGGVADA